MSKITEAFVVVQMTFVDEDGRKGPLRLTTPNEERPEENVEHACIATKLQTGCGCCYASVHMPQWEVVEHVGVGDGDSGSRVVVRRVRRVETGDDEGISPSSQDRI